MIGCVGIAGQRSETQTSAGGLFDIRQRQVIDINDARRLLHTIFHQIDKIGTAGQEFGAARPRDRFESRIGLFSAAIFEWIYEFTAPSTPADTRCERPR